MKSEQEVIKNIVQIRNLQGLTKRYVAQQMCINEASYGRIESEKVALSYSDLAKIASIFKMPVIDIITFPDKYVISSKKMPIEEEPVEAVLQIKLKKEKKDQVLKLVFGENDIEILNR